MRAALAPCSAARRVRSGTLTPGGEVAGAEHDGHVVAHGRPHGVEQLETLLHRQVRGLTRGAGHDEGAHAPAGEVFGVAGGGGQVDMAALVEERDEGHGRRR